MAEQANRSNTMEQRPFGATGRDVAVVGQGTWYIEQADRKAAVAALRRGLDDGMTHIDTAEMYGSGAAEEVVAEAIAGRRLGEVFKTRIFEPLGIESMTFELTDAMRSKLAGIHARGAANGQERCAHRGGDEHAADNRKRRRIRRHDAVKLAGQELGARQRGAEADREAGAHEKRRLPADERRNLRRPRAERHPQPDLPGAARDGVAQNPRDADDRQHERQSAEHPRIPAGRTDDAGRNKVIDLLEPVRAVRQHQDGEAGTGEKQPPGRGFMRVAALVIARGEQRRADGEQDGDEGERAMHVLGGQHLAAEQ